MVALYMADVSTPLGDAIRRLRGQTGMSQAELSRLSSVGREYISMIETGKRENPSHEIMKALARGFGITVGHLYREAGRAFDDNGNGDDERIVRVPDRESATWLRRMAHRFGPEILALLFDFGESVERRARRELLEEQPPDQGAEDEPDSEEDEHEPDA